jgi:3-methyladenine DNA glycosylase AlkD
MSLSKLIVDLKNHANKEKSLILQRFFKTGKGDYGEGDIFWGLTVPAQREIIKNHYAISLAELEQALKHFAHEVRFSALQILVRQYKTGNTELKKKIFRLYIKNAKRINNWDLVDLSAPQIVGDYLLDRPKDILYTFARSKNLWERRIAILSTFMFIRHKQFTDALRIAEILLHDKHDLIHKATGWMLREIGKRDQKIEKKFLDTYASKMPRTMLRYAIEKFPKTVQKNYLNKK